MKISYLGHLWHATFKHRSGTICMGYAPTLREALLYCTEIVIEQDRRATQ